MTEDDLKGMVSNVLRRLRITKVVATRAVKTRNAEYFAGFAGAWDSVQEDSGGPGADLDLVMSASEVTSSGMTLKQAKIAQHLLAMQADLAAYEQAFANGDMTEEKYREAVQAIKHNYAKLIREAFLGRVQQEGGSSEA